MDRMTERDMDNNGLEGRLDALFAEYRSTYPDPEGSVNFMPNLWQKIEARRMESVSIFRRLTQACVLATAALTVAMVILIPRIQSEPVYTATYVDVLDAAHSVDSAQLMDSQVIDSQMIDSGDLQ